MYDLNLIVLIELPVLRDVKPEWVSKLTLESFDDWEADRKEKMLSQGEREINFERRINDDIRDNETVYQHMKKYCHIKSSKLIKIVMILY